MLFIPPPRGLVSKLTAVGACTALLLISGSGCGLLEGTSEENPSATTASWFGWGDDAEDAVRKVTVELELSDRHEATAGCEVVSADDSEAIGFADGDVSCVALFDPQQGTYLIAREVEDCSAGWGIRNACAAVPLAVAVVAVVAVAAVGALTGAAQYAHIEYTLTPHPAYDTRSTDWLLSFRDFLDRFERASLHAPPKLALMRAIMGQDDELGAYADGYEGSYADSYDEPWGNSHELSTGDETDVYWNEGDDADAYDSSWNADDTWGSSARDDGGEIIAMGYTLEGLKEAARKKRTAPADQSPPRDSLCGEMRVLIAGGCGRNCTVDICTDGERTYISPQVFFPLGGDDTPVDVEFLHWATSFPARVFIEQPTFYVGSAHDELPNRIASKSGHSPDERWTINAEVFSKKGMKRKFANSTMQVQVTLADSVATPSALWTVITIEGLK